MDEPLSGSIIVQAGQITGEDGNLVARLEVSTNVAGFRAYEGPLIITGTPRWDSAAEVLSLEEPRLAIETEDWVTALLANILDNTVMRRWLARHTSISLSNEIATAEQSLREAIAEPRPSGLRLSGDIDLGATDFAVENGRLRLTLRALGRLEVTGLDLR